jgi:hypothetical protein
MTEELVNHKKSLAQRDADASVADGHAGQSPTVLEQLDTGDSLGAQWTVTAVQL